MALFSPISELAVGWSCFHVAMITSPPKIPAFAFSGSRVLIGSPLFPWDWEYAEQVLQ